MYNSLKEHCIQFEIFILCLDDFTLEYFKNRREDYPEIKTLLLRELEDVDIELKSCRANRTKIEYYFTLSPCLPLYLLKKYDLPHICSLDADILFLDSPQKLFDFLVDYSIVITPHKFSDEIKHLVEYGIYNVSFQIFKNDETGLKCLENWRLQCIDWCGDQFDEYNNRFADQKYLDNWMDLYPNKVKKLDDTISGIAPWNLNNYRITKKKDKFYSENERIIFYHFHHFKLLSKIYATNGLYTYKVKFNNAIGKLYLLYWNKLNGFNDLLDISNDKTTRHILSNNLWIRMFNEKYVCINLLKRRLFYFNLSPTPNIIKRILIKMGS